MESDCKFTLRFLLKTILLGLLITISVRGIQKIIEEDTNVSIKYVTKSLLFPAVTLCPYVRRSNSGYTSNSKFETLVQAYEAIPTLSKSDMDINFLSVDNIRDLGTLSNSHKYDVQDVTEVLSLEIMDQNITKCVTINPPTVSKASKNVLFIVTVNATRHDTLWLEIHEPGQSSINHKWRWDKISLLKSGIHKMVMLTAEAIDLVSTKYEPCLPPPGINKTQCMYNYLEHKLGCKLPWSSRGADNSSRSRLCDQPKDLKKFVNMYANFNDTDVEKFGCLEENCRQVRWDRIWTEDDIAPPDKFGNPTAKLQLGFQGNIPTTFVKHSFSYTFANFAADFGGYVGLLLGASILSLFDVIWEYGVKKSVNVE